MRVWLVLACNTAAEKAFGPDPVSPFMPTVPSPTPGTEPTSHTSEPPTDAVESCDDGLDNDDDGASDCLDDDCVAPGCAELCPCDGDLDGYATSALGGSDCDDAVATVHPDAAEFCDAIDNDCDALIDDDDSDTVDNIVVWFDGDGDGYGTEDQPLRAALWGRTSRAKSAIVRTTIRSCFPIRRRSASTALMTIAMVLSTTKTAGSMKRAWRPGIWTPIWTASGHPKTP